MIDLDQLLRSDISHAAARAAEPPEFAIIERRGTQRRRHRTMLTAAAAAAVVVLAVGVLARPQSGDQGQQLPAGDPSPSRTEPTTPPTSTTSATDLTTQLRPASSDQTVTMAHERNGWELWPAAGRETLPQQRRPPGKRDVAADGTEYELRSRVLDLDPLLQQMSMEMEAFMWRGGELVARDTQLLTLTFYFRDEIVLMLNRAGFVDVTVGAAITDAAPTAAENVLVYTALRPPDSGR